MQQPKALQAKVVGYQPGEQGIHLTLRLGPNTDKSKLEQWLGEENAHLLIAHAPAEIQTSNKKPQKKGGALSKAAAVLCKQPAFYEWMLLNGEVHNPGSHARNETEVAKRLKAICNINSRSELDHNKEAEKVFHERIRKPFHSWLQEQKG